MNTTATHAVLHSQSSWPQQGFLTQSVMSTISTLSLSHTHTAYVTIHTHTQDWSYLQESLHPIHLKDSDTHRTSSLSTIPRNQGCHRHVHTHTHTHTHHPPINHTVTSGNHRASYRYILSVCHSRHLCHTDCGHPPRPHPNTHFFLCSGGSNRVASPKSPIFSSMFSVIKKFPEQGRRNVSDAFFSASPAPHPVGPGVSPSLRSRCKMPRWCKYLSPERICRR